MYSRDYLDDYDPSSTYLDAFSTTGRTAAERRKNDWKYAKRNQAIVDAIGGTDKPLHYYVKTAPEYYYNRYNKTNNKGKHRNAYGNYNAAKNWSPNDKRKINDCQNQIQELFDEE